MDTEVAVKLEPMWLMEDEEVNNVDTKNEAELSAEVCNDGNRMLKSDIEVKCLLEDSSECSYRAEGMDTEVTVKPEFVWLVEGEEMSQAHVKDEGIVSAADYDEINEELKSEIDIEENCILGDSSEFLQSCKVAGDANGLENEGFILSSTDKLQADEGYMLEHEEQVTVNEEKRESGISTKGYSQVHHSFSKSAHTSETHTGEKPFKCKECSKGFNVSGSLKQHMMTHTGERPFKCKECSKCFNQSIHLKKHMMTHTGNKPFQCKECGKSFIQSVSLKQHMMTHTGNMPFKCKECSKCFKQSGNLKQHMMTHTGNKPFQCKGCSKYFTSSSQLKEHMSLHTGEKPFKCKECCKCFTHSSNLKQHMMTHTGNKPFQCNECSKCFTHPSSLKYHMTLHTGEKPIKCKECSKGFNRSGDLKHHMMTHTGNKPFQCNECSKCFTSSSHLKRHLNTHRREAL